MRNSTLHRRLTSQRYQSLGHAELLELQRLAELGRLSATLLHEISNPLTAAMLHLEASETPSADNIRQARKSIRQLRRYVQAARQQVRRESTLTDFRLRPQLAQIKRIVLPLARRAGVQLAFESPPDCHLYGDAVKFQQILANLIVNAIEAYGTADDLAPYLDKPVRVRLYSSEHALTIQVYDWGQGISPRNINRVFEPFYTTKSQAGHGLGIGLAIVKQYVMTDFGGTIAVQSSRRHGTLFTVSLPTLYRPVEE
jgi:two-component system C4-dicarboxylate transport sensor histidine kinase DctB